MNLFKNLSLSLHLFFVTSVIAAESKFDSGKNDLNNQWQEEEIYFQPKDKKSYGNWNGTIYHYGLKKCFELVEKNLSKIDSTEIKCELPFLKKATEPYTKISDFETYKARILQCLDRQDHKCLRGLISKTLQVSFGFDGWQDRRDYIF